jgi:predicted dithiol-disulfide oxidoreductase (DUF899 family)
MNRPEVVSEQEWQEAHESMLAKEKELMRARDAVAAERRRQPMMKIEKAYEFEGPQGTVTLAGLFEGRHQLALYNFMFAPGDAEPCGGCSVFADMLGRLEHAHNRDLTIALASRAPADEIDALKKRMEWEHIPWYSAGDEGWNQDHGFSSERGEIFGLTMLLRDGDEVFRTWSTGGRGTEAMNALTLLDMAPFGRQEEWEDSPEGWPQAPAYTLDNFHHAYPEEPEAPSYRAA